MTPKSTRWAQANPERHRELCRDYYHRNKEQQKEKAKAWRGANPTKRKALDERGRIRKYGLTPEAYEQLLRSQGGRCAICGEAFSDTPHIDHCHTSGSVRGLLCRGCNTGLGKFRDSLPSLHAAIQYLTRKPIPWTPPSPVSA